MQVSVSNTFQHGWQVPISQFTSTTGTAMQDLNCDHVPSNISIVNEDQDIIASNTILRSPQMLDLSIKKAATKSVRFFHMRSVQTIPQLSATPKKIIEDCWFGPKDIAAMEKSVENIVDLMDNGLAHLVDENESTRGLENKTQLGAWERYKRNQDACNAVLDEQERQWGEGVEDPYIISQIYQKYSKESTDIALAKAEDDENEIVHYVAFDRCALKNSIGRDNPNMKNTMRQLHSFGKDLKKSSRKRVEHRFHTRRT